MPAVEIVAVGTELLLGQLVDTNTAHIAQALASAGINVFATHAVGDNRSRITRAIGEALERSDGVITSGGLGPTIDDLTKESICDLLAVETELNNDALATMIELFARLGREMRENNRKQALLPRGSVVLTNHHGTAPGFYIERADGKFIASMPGVPREMKPMLAEQLLPLLRKRFSLNEAIYTRILHTVNIAESEIDHRIADVFAASENPKIAVLAHDYRCDVKIMARAASRDEAEKLVAPIEHDVLRRLDGHVFGVDEQTLPGAIHVLLQHMGARVAVAESCTGGSICAALTSVPGSSKSFNGGIVAYANIVKTNSLGVDAGSIEHFGAVSEEVARAMAQGVRTALASDYGVATTGIAGPDGGSEQKPVGLVFIAIAGVDGVAVHRLQLRGDRAAIQARATTAALGLLWRALARKEPF